MRRDALGLGLVAASQPIRGVSKNLLHAKKMLTEGTQVGNTRVTVFYPIPPL